MKKTKISVPAPQDKHAIAISPGPEKETEIATSVRLPKSMHDALRSIVYEEGNRGNRLSIHSLILEGIEKVIHEKG
jgi:hypothetical protein